MNAELYGNKGEPECNSSFDLVTGDGCSALMPEEVESCEYKSIGLLFIYLQHTLITKLVFYTLIVAICSVTMSNTYAKTIEIWKYRFYILVEDFVQRPSLPVPLVILSYPLLITRCCFEIFRHFCQDAYPCCRKEKEKTKNEGLNAWKVYVNMQKREERKEMDDRESINRNNERLLVMTQDINENKKQIDSLNDRLVTALNSQTSVLLLLEKMAGVFKRIGLITDTRQKDDKSVHYNCRNAIYPGTTVQRSVVFEKSIPWEELYDTYDPPEFTKPVEEYELDLKPFVDPDAFEIKRLEEERVVMEMEKQEEGDRQLDIPDFHPTYNDKIETVIAATGEVFILNRITWLDNEGEENEYSLDDSGVPRNPMGRTGMRGRGNLWRWGPNHTMSAIITRWRSSYSSGGQREGPLVVRGSGVLEMILIYDEELQENVLPGGFVSGRTTKYSVVCETFMRSVLKDDDVQGSKSLDQDDMIQFFRAFVLTEDRMLALFLKSSDSNLEAKQVYRGYIDHRNNTDNAWVEAEIWHFHYNKDLFDKRIVEREWYWHEVSPQMNLSKSYLSYVLEAADSVSLSS